MFRRLIAIYFLSGCLALGAAVPPAHSQDCNGNSTPDASEPDCNGNGTPDDCDIAAGAAFDFNENGIPDACERTVSGVIFVHRNAPPGGDGSCWGRAFNELQAGLAAATQGAQIWVARGAYKPTNGADRTVFFRMKEGVDVYGGFAGGELELDLRDAAANETILHGDLLGDDGPGFTNRSDNTHHVVYALNVGDWTLDGFTIRAGYSQLTAEELGGGAYVNAGGRSGITFRNCTFIDNWGKRNGAVHLGNARAPTVLESCRFLGNRCEPAGGASGGGGAVSIGNIFEGQMTIRQCVFSGNTSNTGGGAVQAYGTVRVENCTFSRNHADIYGGAIFNNGTVVDLVNSIFWDNSSGQLSGVRGELMGFSETFNLTHVCLQDWNANSPYQGPGMTGANPLFADGDGADNLPGTIDDDLRLSALSASVDGGDSSLLSPSLIRDLGGNVRVVDGNGDASAIVDLGAFEFAAAGLTDCNDNGMDDVADLAAGTSVDAFPAGGNGIPDECDADCNTNGTPDAAEIAGMQAADCNSNGVPDECEPDCNANGTPDACDIAAGASRDCVADGVPDECGQDCNLNCIADAVDVAPGAFTDSSPQIMPFNDGSTPRTHTLPAPPPASSDVTLSFTTYRDLVNLLRVEVRLNGTLIGNVFTDNGLPAGCRTGTAQLTLSAEQFNALVAGQDAEIRMQPVAGAWAVCSGTYIRVTTTYSVAPHSADCDVNSLPDECQSEFTDVALFITAVLADSPAPGEVCMYDANADGLLDGLDIAGFVARALGE